MTRRRERFYAGFSPFGNMRVFQSRTVPTAQTHGAQYAYCIGPFRTRRGAEYMVAHRFAPYGLTVAEAERLAAKEDQQ